MSDAQRILVYDATLVCARPDLADPLDRGLARALASRADPRIALVRHAARGLIRIRRPLIEETASLGDAEEARAWLLGRPAAPAPRRRRPGIALRGLLEFLEPVYEPPAGALLLAAGWRPWADRRLISFLLARPDVKASALAERPLELDFPEYAASGEAAAAQAAWATLGDYDSSLEPLRAAAQARPSPLAGSRPSPFDPELALEPYFIQAGPAEARANTLSLLQIWRDFAASGRRPPKLLLAGDLGRQRESIAPMLDWCEAIRPHVRLIGPIAPDGLRLLIRHARALLAPDFAGADPALLRDAQLLGVPTMASIQIEAASASHKRIDPLAGAEWRRAIGEAAQAPVRAGRDEAALPDWSGFAAKIAEVLLG